tara:strand:- start:38374 stop:39915 length:1542 start_codon:yes stop_codon:yes gene_type:complete
MNLTPEQHEAATSKGWAVQIITALAGTGKTTTAAARIQDRIANGIDPADIIAITFTRAGGKALQDKIEAKLGWAGTLHAFCMSRMGIDQASLLTDDEAEEAIKDELSKLGLKGISHKQAAAALSDPGLSFGNASLFVRAFENTMKRTGRTTFDLILRSFIKDGYAEARPHPSVLLVDEAQDTAPIDAAIYAALEPDELIVVGDTNQAIYGFRGATDEWMSQQDGDGAHYPLTATFRCSQAVTEIANGIIHERIAAGRSQPMQTTAIAPEGEADYRGFNTERAEEDHLLEWASQQPGSVAILARNNHTVDRIRRAFESAGIRIQPQLRERSSKSTDLATALLRGIWDGLPLSAIKQHHPSPQIYMNRWGSDGTLRRHLLELETPAQRMAACGAPGDVLAMVGYAATEQEALIAVTQGRELEDTTGIHIDTIHASKGREFDSVAIAAADQRMDTGDQARNLCYVAATRAKASLLATFSHITIDPWSTKHQAAAASRTISAAFHLAGVDLHGPSGE